MASSIVPGDSRRLLSLRSLGAAASLLALCGALVGCVNRKLALPLSTDTFAIQALSSIWVQQLGTPSISATAGQTISIQTRFTASVTRTDYLILVHFVDSQGKTAAFRADFAPSVPTSKWNGAVSEDHAFTIPASAPAGQYSIRVGLYQASSSGQTRMVMAAGPGVKMDDQYRYVVGSLTLSTASGGSGPSGGGSAPQVPFPGTLPNLTPSGPIAISGQNGTVISGLRISNPNGPCIEISNSTNITIKGNEIGPCRIGVHLVSGGGFLIQGNSIHNTVPLTSNSTSAEDDPGILSENNVTGVSVAFNYIADVTTGYLAWGGNHLLFDHNYVGTVHSGDFSRIGGQMVQIGTSGPDIRITCNISDQTGAGAMTEDHVNLWQSSGTASNPILVAYNKVIGYGPSTSNGGLLAGDGVGNYVVIDHNNVIHAGGYGVAIAGGYGNVISNNKIYGRINASWAKGIYVKDFSGSPAFGGHAVIGNKVNYFASGGGGEDINPSATTVSGNVFTTTSSTTDIFGDGSNWTVDALWNESFDACK